MGIAGEIQLTLPTINGLGTMSSGTTFDPGVGSGDIYNFSYDFNNGATFTFAGDFNDMSGFEAPNGYATDDSGLAGTLAFNTTDGIFTYTVTAAQIASSSTNQTFTATGAYPNGLFDLDRINFTFTLCFAAGTGIATPNGETAVEALQIGDLLRTADGRDVPVKWVGRVTAKPMFNPADRLAPVRIAKGALGPNTPHTDVIVTADHGMVLDGLIINAAALVNGATITWLDWRQIGESITYYHVETQAHDIILANGAASESYLDLPDRRSFDNCAEYAALYGQDEPMRENALPRIAAQRLVPRDLRLRLGLGEAA